MAVTVAGEVRPIPTTAGLGEGGLVGTPKCVVATTDPFVSYLLKTLSGATLQSSPKGQVWDE